MRTQKERDQHGAAMRAVYRRRQERATAGLGRKVHRRCIQCGRLLVPEGGRVPPHRCPPPRISAAKHVPLTGADAPWCKGKVFA